MAQANRQKKPTKNIPKPPPQPAKAGPMCPPSTMYGFPPVRIPPLPRDSHDDRRGPVSSITAPSPAVDPGDPLIPVSRSRRRTELIMLIFAFALVAFAFANVGFSLKGKLPSGLAEYMAAYHCRDHHRPPGHPQVRALGGPAAASARGPA